MPRRNSKHLTDPGIAKIGKAPKGKRIERFDAGADGLCLRVTDRGTKSWCVYYHLRDLSGRSGHHRITLGPWPTIGVAQARTEAQRVRDLVRDGLDPKQVRAEADAVVRRQLLPAWGGRLITEIKRSDLTELTDQLLDARTPMAAHRLHEVAKRIFNWSLHRGDIDASPFAAMKAPIRKEPRGKVLSHDDIQALWGACEAMGYPFGSMIKILILTGQRRSEVAEMTWKEIDLKKTQWTIPAERSKSKREHIVPLPDYAVRVIQAVPRFDAGQYVFSTTTGRRPVSGFSKAKRQADRTSKLTGWRFHDLRRTVRTELARLGVPEVVGERVLNHLPRGLTKTYNKYDYLREKRDALSRWSQEVQSMASPPPANVVPLVAGGEPA
jgi:integrase